MRKRTKGRKFNRKRDARNAMMRSMAEALIKNERIETTEARAKELRPYIERWVTKSGNNSLHTQRQVRKVFSDKASQKLIRDLGPRFKDRNGGYTRIIRHGSRPHDAAKRAIIEFVDKGTE